MAILGCQLDYIGNELLSGTGEHACDPNLETGRQHAFDAYLKTGRHKFLILFLRQDNTHL